MRKFLVSFFSVCLLALSLSAFFQIGEKFAQAKSQTILHTENNAEGNEAKEKVSLSLDSISYTSSLNQDFVVSFYVNIGAAASSTSSPDNAADKTYTISPVTTKFLLCIDPSTYLNTRTTLENWANGADGQTDADMNTGCIYSKEYTISSEQRITMSTKMSGFGFNADTVWGPKRVFIYQEGKPYDVFLKTFTVFNGANKPSVPLDLSILTHFDDISYYKPSITDEAKAVGVSLSAGGNLNKLMRFANINKNISLAVDPAIYSALNLAEDGGITKGISYFKRSIQSHETYYLPWDDINITALENNKTSVSDLGVYNLLDAQNYRTNKKNIGWFNQNEIDRNVIKNAEQSNINSFIVVPENNAYDSIFTPSPEGFIDLDKGSANLYTPDYTISQVLSGKATSDKSEAENTTTGRVARFMAETAFVNMELPSISRNVLAVFDRGAIEKYSDSDLSNLSNAVQNAKWLNITKFSYIENEQPYNVPIPETATISNTQLSNNDISSIYQNLDKISDFSNGLSLYNSTQNFIYNYAARLTSKSLENDINKRNDLFSHLDSVTNSLLDCVKINTSDSVNILASDIQFAVGVKNTLARKVKLNLHIDHDNYITTDKDSYSIELEPNSQITINVPLHARANGSTDMKITMISGNGKQIGNPADLKVNIFVQFTSIGTVAFFTLLPALFIIGLIRTIKKRAGSSTRQKGLNV